MASTYDKGYLDGQLDAAENELDILRMIKRETFDDLSETDMINVRIRDMEKFLRENGREVEPEDE